MAHPAHPIAAQTLIDLTDPPTIHGHAKIGPIKLHELLNHEQVLGVRAQRIAKRQFEELSSKSWLKAQLAFYNLEPPRGTSSQELLELLRQCVKDELASRSDVPSSSAASSRSQPKARFSAARPKTKVEPWESTKAIVHRTLQRLEQTRKEKFDTLATPVDQANYNAQLFLSNNFDADASTLQDPIALPGLNDRSAVRQAVAEIDGLETLCLRNGTERVLVIGWNLSDPCVAVKAVEAAEEQTMRRQSGQQKSKLKKREPRGDNMKKKSEPLGNFEKQKRRRESDQRPLKNTECFSSQRRLDSSPNRRKPKETEAQRVLKASQEERKLDEAEGQALGWRKDLKLHEQLLHALPHSSQQQPFSIDKIEGRYSIACPSMKDAHSGHHDKMSLDITYDTASGWIGIFNFGIVQGMMKFDTDVEALVARCYADVKQEEAEYEGGCNSGLDIAKEEEQWSMYRESAEVAFTRHASTAIKRQKKRKAQGNSETQSKRRKSASISTPASTPTSSPEQTSLSPHIVYFKWRGRETQEHLIEHSETNNFGHFLFHDATCTKFDGAFDSNFFGENVAFQGYRVRHQGGNVTKEWRDFSEILFKGECRELWPS